MSCAHCEGLGCAACDSPDHMAAVGVKMARFDHDAANGSYHRDASNSRAYRDAYDRTMAECRRGERK